MATPTPAPAEHEHVHPNIVLATLALASFMSVMDLFIVNVALQTIGTDLHHALSDVAWVLNAYALIFGALLIPAGRFSDKYGRKNVFMLGLAIFTIASLACAVSPDLWVLIAFRCVQATGAAMLIPSSLGLVLTTMPPARVKRSVRLWAVSGAAAGAIGPVVGGLLTALSWRWIFLINLPIGIAVIAVTWKMIPNVRHDLSTKMPDPIGSVMRSSRSAPSRSVCSTLTPGAGGAGASLPVGLSPSSPRSHSWLARAERLCQSLIHRCSEAACSARRMSRS